MIVDISDISAARGCLKALHASGGDAVPDRGRRRFWGILRLLRSMWEAGVRVPFAVARADAKFCADDEVVRKSDYLLSVPCDGAWAGHSYYVARGGELLYLGTFHEGGIPVTEVCSYGALCAAFERQEGRTKQPLDVGNKQS